MSVSAKVLDHIGDASSWDSPIPGIIGDKFRQGILKMVRRRQNMYRMDRLNGFVARQYSEKLQRYLGGLDLNNPTHVNLLSFEYVLANVIGQKLKRYPENEKEDQLVHWLKQIDRKGGNFRILTNVDDWSVPPGAFEQLPQEFRDPQHLLVRASGGHAGITTTDWFETFSLGAMDLNKVEAH